MDRTEVLIVGAGPTGLVLALWLTRLGIRVRVLDKAAEPGQASRALAVQARTLEHYRQIGLDRDVVRAGYPIGALNLWVEGERKAHLRLSEIGAGASPFPYVLVYAQDEHERLLIAHLAELGVHVERPLELTRLDATVHGVTAELRRPDGALETCAADFVAGCDGAHSFVREAVAVPFAGGTYSHLFYVADVIASGPVADGEAHFALESDSNFLACLAFGPGHLRLIGTLRTDAADAPRELGWNDVSTHVIERMQLRVDRVNWFSTYRVHHRVAAAFRVGRVFLLGDAGHIHSPVGGQGMNTGIGDAINLAWKLGLVLRGRSDERILRSYEEERLPFAHRLVHTTDRVFELVAGDGALARRARVDVLPPILALLFRSDWVGHWLFHTVSQLGIDYRGSWLSEGRAGDIHGGDRLPWITNDDATDNYVPLRSLDWQAHVYGDAPADLKSTCSELRVPIHTFPWSARADAAGVARDAAYLVRPDGYVALATPGAHAAERFRAYWGTRALRMPDGS